MFVWTARIGASLILGTALVLGVGGVASAGPVAYSDVQVGELQHVVDQNRLAFGGLVGDPLTGIVTIFVAESADPNAVAVGIAATRLVGSLRDPELRSTPKTWAVRFSTGGPSLASLDDVMKAVAVSEPWRTHIAPEIASWGIDPKRHAVRVGLTQIRPEIEKEAHDRFGDRVVLETEARAVRHSRLYDSVPWWGGDRVALFTGSGTQCTVSFVVQQGSTGDRGMLGAGHCYTSGTGVYQGYYSGGVFYMSGLIGKVTAYQFGDYTVDAEFIDATAVGTTVQDSVYVTSTAGKLVVGSGTSFVGMSVCFDGSFTGENCNGAVTLYDQCAYLYPYTTCHMTQAQSSTRLSQPGDSGGPVYKLSGAGGVRAYGHIVGGRTDGTSEWYSELNPTLTALGLLLVAN